MITILIIEIMEKILKFNKITNLSNSTPTKRGADNQVSEFNKRVRTEGPNQQQTECIKQAQTISIFRQELIQSRNEISALQKDVKDLKSDKNTIQG